MREEVGDPERLVSRSELEELADLFDRFEFALDPLSAKAREAESEFENKVRQLFSSRIAPKYPDLGLSVFRCRVRTWCRRFLQKSSRQ